MNTIHIHKHSKAIGFIPLFDPLKGRTVVKAPGRGKGFWAGAPSAFYDYELKKFFLYYRLRKPRGKGRGYECRIARSDDGIRFEDIWCMNKKEISSPSIERAALYKTLDLKYRLYISYVDSSTNQWRTDMMSADRPDKFSPRTLRKVFTPDEIWVDGIKDPVLYLVGRKYYMFLSAAVRGESYKSVSSLQLHASEDCFCTGMIVAETGYATSIDGVNFEWQGPLLTKGTVWDCYCSRISTLLYRPPVIAAFYDGASCVEQNYEEKTGLIFSLDMKNWDKVSQKSPILASPHASGSLRYMDALQIDSTIFYYYELALKDGSHELRVSKIEL